MHDTAYLQQTQQSLTRSFVSALAVTTAMALLGGLLIGDAMLRRIEAVNRTASAIMQGDFTHRIPSEGRHNELADLTENLNHMFARIQALNVIDAYTVVAEDQVKVIQSHIESNVTVLGVQKLLSQTIVNIIENALRHTPPHARIAITLNIRVDQPILTIADNGAGIPESERDNVFQRFYRLDSSRSTPGSGLGVSFVKAVAILHQASIRLEEASPGLSVVIEFPVQDESR